MHNIINFLDPKNVLQVRDWVALSSLAFTIFSFFTAQYLTARSQRKTRQLAVRPYFLLSSTRRNINLSTAEEGIGIGKMVVTSEYKKLWDAHKNNTNVNGQNVNQTYYLKVQNLGPTYALDCNFHIKCREKNGSGNWKVEGYVPIFNKDEYIYIPLENVKYYNNDRCSVEIKLSFKTQFNESIVLKQGSDKTATTKMVIHKKILWGIINKKIIEFPKVNGQFRNID